MQAPQVGLAPTHHLWLPVFKTGAPTILSDCGQLYLRQDSNLYRTLQKSVALPLDHGDLEWTGQDLNLRRVGLQPTALPTELPVHNAESGCRPHSSDKPTYQFSKLTSLPTLSTSAVSLSLGPPTQDTLRIELHSYSACTDSRTRTYNHSLVRRTLSQLSYICIQ